MIKVELWDVFGSGAMAGTNGKPHQYWEYKTVVMVKGSVKRALKYANRVHYESANDPDGFSFIPVLGHVKVWKDGKLIIDKD